MIISRPFAYTPGSVILSSQLNQNETVLYNAVNGGIDAANVGTLGFQAAQIKPTTSAQATFGGSAGITYTLPFPLAVISLSLVSPLPATSGGTGLGTSGSSGNILTSNGTAWASTTPSFVDLTTAQTIGGVKTFSAAPVFSGASITTATVPNAALVTPPLTGLTGGAGINVTGTAPNLTITSSSSATNSIVVQAGQVLSNGSPAITFPVAANSVVVGSAFLILSAYTPNANGTGESVATDTSSGVNIATAAQTTPTFLISIVRVTAIGVSGSLNVAGNSVSPSTGASITVDTTVAWSLLLKLNPTFNTNSSSDFGYIQQLK